MEGIAGHHETMQVFHAPAGFHPFHGEPIQEFRVGREAAVSAKIKHTLYQGLVKVSHPYVIDADASRKRIFDRSYPLGQGFASTGTGFRVLS